MHHKIACLSRISGWKLIFIISLVLLSASCTKKQDDKKTTEIIIDTTQVLVIDCEGDVFKRHNDEWEEIENNTILAESDVVKTGPDSCCDLQFGDTALVRVSENTILNINAVLTETGSSSITVGLNAGSILCKVQKLALDEEFHVETRSAVCSVRGTGFGVEIRESDDITLYVDEGACAVIPVRLAPNRFKAKLKNKPELSAAVLAEIEKSILIVKHDEEVIVNPSAMAKADTYIDELNKKIDEAVLMDTVDDASKEKIVSLVGRSFSEAISGGMELKDISKINKNRLDDLKNINARKVKIKSRELKLEKEGTDKQGNSSEIKKEDDTADISADGNGSAGQKDEDKLSKDSDKKNVITQQIEVHTTPDKAKIYLDNRFTGFSPCIIKKVPAGNHIIRIEKNGYETVIKEITLRENNEAEFHNIILKKKEIEKGKLTVISVPDGAAAYLDGEYIGKTPCSVDALEFGEYLLKLDMRGYSGKTATVIMNEKQKEAIFSLKPENCEVAGVEQIIAYFGEASNFRMNDLDILLKKRNQSEPVVLDYFCCFHFFVVEKRLATVLFTGEQKDIFTIAGLKPGMMRSDVISKMGEPDAIFGERGTFKYVKKGIEIEFREEEVTGIRIFKLDPLLSAEPDSNAVPEFIRFIELLRAFPAKFNIGQN